MSMIFVTERTERDMEKYVHATKVTFYLSFVLKVVFMPSKFVSCDLMQYS